MSVQTYISPSPNAPRFRDNHEEESIMDRNPEDDRKLFEALLTVVSYGDPDPETTALLKEQLALREQMVQELEPTVH